MAEKWSWVDPGDPDLSVRRQCELLGLHRSNLYYEAVPESAENLALMRLIDEEYLRRSFLGSLRMELYLEGLGHVIGRKKVQRFMRQMGIEGLAPGPRGCARIRRRS